jgi:hypothetical protein
MDGVREFFGTPYISFYWGKKGWYPCKVALVLKKTRLGFVVCDEFDYDVVEVRKPPYETRGEAVVAGRKWAREEELICTG